MADIKELFDNLGNAIEFKLDNQEMLINDLYIENQKLKEKNENIKAILRTLIEEL